MNNAEKRTIAKELFFLGYEQGRIAKLVEVSEQTLSAWVNKDHWKEDRAKKAGLDDSISNQILDLLDYQLRAIRSGMEHLNRERETREQKDGKEYPLPPIGKGEIDALSKLFAGVKQKDIQWTHFVNVCKELNDFIATKDPAFSIALVDFIDSFLIQKRELLT